MINVGCREDRFGRTYVRLLRCGTDISMKVSTAAEVKQKWGILCSRRHHMADRHFPANMLLEDLLVLFCRNHEAHSCQKATTCGCQAQACSTWLKNPLHVSVTRMLKLLTYDSKVPDILWICHLPEAAAVAAQASPAWPACRRVPVPKGTCGCASCGAALSPCLTRQTQQALISSHCWSRLQLRANIYQRRTAGAGASSSTQMLQ